MRAHAIPFGVLVLVAAFASGCGEEDEQAASAGSAEGPPAEAAGPAVTVEIPEPGNAVAPGHGLPAPQVRGGGVDGFYVNESGNGHATGRAQVAEGGGPVGGGPTGAGPAGGKPTKPVKAGKYKISGPYVHDNLSVFLLHGPDRMKNKVFLTLNEAMAQKKVIVHETGNVGTLSIENVSNEEVFVHSGDIVKGGKQDRVLAYDMVIKPKSGKLPISSYCVEQGRWASRGAEKVTEFGRNEYNANSKHLKIAAKYHNDQGKVWEEVSKTQSKLSASVGERVNSAQSGSSLQLSLENKAVKRSSDTYIKKLEKIVEGKNDAVGFAFAINGEVNSVDVYVSNAFFKKLWPKLLKASAMEAVAEVEKGKTPKPVAAEAVKATMDDANQGKASRKQFDGNNEMYTQETKKSLRFTTTYSSGKDPKEKPEVIHDSYNTQH